MPRRTELAARDGVCDAALHAAARRDALRHNGTGNLNQVRRIATVERKFENSFVLDDLTERRLIASRTSGAAPTTETVSLRSPRRVAHRSPAARSPAGRCRSASRNGTRKALPRVGRAQIGKVRQHIGAIGIAHDAGVTPYRFESPSRRRREGRRRFRLLHGAWKSAASRANLCARNVVRQRIRVKR
jgi:hypothetical protein